MNNPPRRLGIVGRFSSVRHYYVSLSLFSFRKPALMCLGVYWWPAKCDLHWRTTFVRSFSQKWSNTHLL